MKKILTFALSMVFTLGCLCGCDGTSNNQTTEKENAAYGVNKVEDYLYTISYDDYDYDAAERYFEETVGDDESFSCSACRSGNFVGRNYDWTYDENAEFVISVPKGKDRHGSIGVAGCHSLLSLTKKAVESGKTSEDYEYLPFFTRDGINDAGVYVNDNMVADGTMGQTLGTNPDGDRLCALMIPRYVLDYADSAEDAIELLKEKNIYMPGTEEYTEEIHFLIADSEDTYVVEFINNELTVLEDEHIMTNFYLTGFDKTEQELSDFAIGVERYNILRDHYESVTTEEEMLELMQSVKFSKYYDTNTVPFWYTDYCQDYSEYGMDLVLTSKDIGDPDLSQSLDGAGKFKEVIEDEIDLFNNRKRDGECWIGVHTSVYDFENKTLSVIAQENGKVFKFDIEGNEIN